MDRIIAKVILIGDHSKSVLRRSYFGENFKEDMSYCLGVDFAVKVVEIEKIVNIEFQIWDLNAHEEFKILRNRFYNGSSAMILVFDSSSIISLFELEKWVAEICELRTCEDLVIVLLSISSDPKNDIVTLRDISNFLSKINEMGDFYDFIYYQTTLEKGENIERCFLDLNHLIISTLQVNSLCQ